MTSPPTPSDTARRAPASFDGSADPRAELAWYVQALTRYWWAALIGAVLGSVLFFVNASRERVMYEGVTTLLVVPPAKAEGAQMNPATFRAIAENATLVSEVIQELKLGAAPHELSPQIFIERRLGVQEVRGTNVVKIAVRLVDPTTAAQASRLLAQKAVLLTRQITAKEGDTTQEQLRNHLTDAFERLQKAENALLSFQKTAQVELAKQDTDAILKERGLLLRLIVDIEGERARLAAAEREIQRQKPTLTVPRSPAAEDALAPRDVPKDEADPRALNLSNPFVNPVYQTLDYQVAMSRTRIALLEKQRTELLNVRKIGGAEVTQLTELYGRQIEEERLKADLELTRKLHQDLASRYAQSRTLALGSVAQLQIIDLALPPERPLSRKRLQKMIFGAAAGFVLAFPLILFLEGRRRRQARGHI